MDIDDLEYAGLAIATFGVLTFVGSLALFMAVKIVWSLF